MNRKSSHSMKHSGKTGVIHFILTREGSSMAEWNSVVNEISKYNRVVQYDRYGYGESLPYTLERTPLNIAVELGLILNRTNISKGCVLIGDGLGALYAATFAVQYPRTISGLILVEPFSPYNSVLASKLGQKISNDLKIDQREYFNSMKVSRLGQFLRANKSKILKNPPFTITNLPQDDFNTALDTMVKSNHFTTAFDEFNEAMDPSNTDMVKKAIEGKKLEIPVIVVTHNREFMEKVYINEYKLNKDEAKKIENLIFEDMKSYLNISSRTKLMESRKGDYVHLEDPETIIEAVDIMDEALLK